MLRQLNRNFDPADGADGLRSLLHMLMIATMAVICLMAAPAGAQVWVGGRPDAVHVEAHNVSLEEVLTALRVKFNLRYRASGSLDRAITGSYNGSLRYVAARLLNGYDFALKIETDGIEVLVMREHMPDYKAVAAKALPVRISASPVLAPVMTAEEASRNERLQFR
jgi:hypothetical protein